METDYLVDKLHEGTKPFDAWCIVEVMGHQRYAGRVTEQTIGGCAFVRIDVPELKDRPAFTKLLGQSAIFSLTPVTREVALDAAKEFRAQPIVAAGYATRQLPFGDDGYDDQDY